MKKEKQKLANLASQKLLGKDYLTDVYFEQTYFNETTTINNVIRDDIFVSTSCDVDEFFVGLLWDVVTYQEEVYIDSGIIMVGEYHSP